MTDNPRADMIVAEVLEVLADRKSNVIDFRSGRPSQQPHTSARSGCDLRSSPCSGPTQGASIPELRRDFSRRLAKCTDEIDALYTEALNSDGYTDDVLALEGEVVDRMARQLNELKRLSKAVR